MLFFVHIIFHCGTCFKTEFEMHENYLCEFALALSERRVSGSWSIIFSTTKAIFRVLALIQPAECEKTSRHPCRYLFFF